MRPHSILRKVVCTEKVAGGARGDEKQNKEEKCLCLLGNNIYVHVYLAFEDYRTFGSDGHTVEWGIMQPAHLDVWVPSVLTGRIQREVCDWHKKRVYPNTCTDYVSEKVKQLIG